MKWFFIVTECILAAVDMRIAVDPTNPPPLQIAAYATTFLLLMFAVSLVTQERK